MRRINTGDRFGSWEVIQYLPRKSLCRCDCGRCEKVVSNGNLTNGRSTGCLQCGLKKSHDKNVGTIQRRVLKDIPTSQYRRLMTTVDNTIKRCSSGYRQSKDYFDRGIRIHQPWLDNKWEFVQYLAALTGSDDPSLVIDRIDNDGDYEPGNLRFATRSVSSFNRRKFVTRHLPDGRFARKTSKQHQEV